MHAVAIFSVLRGALTILSACAFLASGQAQEPPRISIADLTSENPETALKALQAFELARTPLNERNEYDTDFAKFSGFHSGLRAQPIGLPGAPPAYYLVTYQYDWHSVPSMTPARRAALFAPDVPASAVLLPEVELRGDIFDADGKEVRSFCSVTHGVVADLNADGKVEVADCTKADRSVEINGAEELISVSSLTIRSAGDLTVSQLRLLLNPAYRGRPISKWWSWRFVDADHDGVYDLQLGRASETGMKVEVTLRWDAFSHRWLGPNPEPWQPFVIVNPGESERAAMSRAGWIDTVAGLAAVPAPPPWIPESGDLDEIPANDVSHPYRNESLAGQTDAELWEFMIGERDLNDVVRERVEIRDALPDFWKTEPRQNALAALRVRLPFESRRVEKFTFDLTDGKSVPMSGDVALRVNDHVQVLHCEPGNSFLALATHFRPGWEIPATDLRTVFRFQKVDVSNEDARRFLQTLWFMCRARRIPSATRPEDTGRDFPSSAATVSLHLNFPNEDLMVRISDGIPAAGSGLDQHAVFDVAFRLFTKEWPARVGSRWEPSFLWRTLRNDRVPPLPLPAEAAAIHDQAAEFLRLYFAGKLPPVFAQEAMVAAMEFGFHDLREEIRRISGHLPRLSRAEEELAEIEAAIKPWVEKYGEDLAGERASFNRRFSSMPAAAATSSGNDVLPGIPGLDSDADAVENKARPPSPEERAVAEEPNRFAPLDALNERRLHLLYSEMSEAEKTVMELRTQAPQATRYLEVRDDPDALQKWLLDDNMLKSIGLPQLARLDPNKAVEVMRAGRANDPAHFDYAIPLALEKLDAPMSSSPEIARFSVLIEGREPLTADNIQALLSPPKNLRTIWNNFSRVLRLAVPPSDPHRYHFAELDEELRRLLEDARSGNYYIPEDALAEACARRNLPGAWEGIESLAPYWDDAANWRRLALLARINPDPYRRPFLERMEANLRETHGGLDEMFFSAWLVDARELKPQLEQFATSGPSDAEGTQSNTRADRSRPTMDRFHEARRVVSIWNEQDSATRACLLIGFALHRPAHFTPDLQPEAWQLLGEQLAAALSPLDTAAQQRVREFLDFAIRQFKTRADFGYDSQRDAPLLHALDETLSMRR